MDFHLIWEEQLPNFVLIQIKILKLTECIGLKVEVEMTMPVYDLLDKGGGSIAKLNDLNLFQVGPNCDQYFIRRQTNSY